MLSKLGSTAFGNQTQYQNKGCIYSRQEKFSGRSIIQSENSSIRMDPERFNSSVIVQHLGSTNDRSLCISRQSQDTNFLHLVSSQKGSSSGCPVDIMGGYDSIIMHFLQYVSSQKFYNTCLSFIVRFS